MIKRKAADAFLEDTKQSIEAVHGQKAIPALLNVTENSTNATFDASKPVLPINIHVPIKDPNDPSKGHRVPLTWRPSDPAYKTYAAAHKLVQDFYPCDPKKQEELARRMPLEANIARQIQSTIIRHPYIENANVKPRTIKLHVVLSPHLELHDTLSWTPWASTPMQYATRVAEELGLPWVCVRRIAQGLTDALKEVKKEEGEDTVPQDTTNTGPTLVRIPRPQPPCPPAIHIQAPTQRDARPGSMLGSAKAAQHGAAQGMVGIMTLVGSQPHSGHAGSGGQPAADTSKTTTQAGPIGSWAAASSQPERPPSQATGLSGPSSVGVPQSTDTATAAAIKVEDTAVGGGVAVGGGGVGVAAGGLGISFKLGGGASVKPKAPAPAPVKLAGFGGGDDDDDEEEDE